MFCWCTGSLARERLCSRSTCVLSVRGRCFRYISTLSTPRTRGVCRFPASKRYSRAADQLAKTRLALPCTQDGTEANSVAFEMKQARLAVVQCLEHLIRLSLSGEGGTAPQLWTSFTSYLQKYLHLLTNDTECVGIINTRNEGCYLCICCHPRIHLCSPNVLVVDENLPLKSMRYVFYQLAKKC